MSLVPGPVVIRKARSWVNSTEGVFLTTVEEMEKSFDQQGQLLSPLLCAYKGPLMAIKACFQAVNLDVSEVEETFENGWQRLLVSRSAQEGK